MGERSPAKPFQPDRLKFGDTVSGTRGLTGAADTVLVLRRDFANKRAKIYGRGRDIAEIEMAMGFDGQTGLWRQLDALEAAAVTPEREAIVRVLVEAGEPLSAKTIAERGGLDYSTSRKILGRMADNGVIAKEGRGLFAWEGSGNAGNRANDDERSDLLDLG